ncbi:MAG: alpha/beta fold hydrolase [Thermomicrobiales bacterium]|nr:alpha/beta fold hydrolase [Thermomicrobiales bacterium]
MSISYSERLLEVLMALVLGITSVLSGLAQQVIEPVHPVQPVAAIVATPFDCAQLMVFDTPLVTPALGQVVCGSIRVPENWSKSEGRQLDITYVVLKSTNPAPKADPILYLEGGPGGSALLGIDAYAGQIFDEMRQDRDIILFDQRGTQFSTPLKCSVLTVEDMFGSGSGSGGSSIDLTQAYDEEQLMQNARADVGADTRRCVHELTASGIDLRQYNSVASARDAVALMEALGYPTYNLFGISYGTRLALVMMRDHPNAGIRSVVLDSSFPPEIPGFERFVTEAHEVVMQLFSDCKLDPICNNAYPNLKERFKTLLHATEQNPIRGADGTLVTAFDLVDVVTAISRYTASAAYIPLMISELEQGITTTYNAIVAGEVESGSSASVGGARSIQSGAQTALASGNAQADPEALAQAQAFVQAVQDRAAQLPPSDGDTVLTLLTWLDKVPRTRASLTEFVNKSFGSPDQVINRDFLLELVETMSDAGVAQVFEMMEQSVDLIDQYTFGLNEPTFNSVECNEEAPFETFSNVIANAQALEIPELAYGTVSFMAEQFATCELWPSGRAREVESRAVVSDIPTLLMAGNYDFQTPISWNRSAFVNLSNSYYVQFPSSGHGVVAQSQCAKDVSREFIDTPFRQPNSGCTADLWPIWAMPPGQ